MAYGVIGVSRGVGWLQVLYLELGVKAEGFGVQKVSFKKIPSSTIGIS